MNAYLLPWNPSSLGITPLVTPINKEEITVRYPCESEQPSVGDTVYLIRLDEVPKGIIGSGTVTQSSISNSDFQNTAKDEHHISVLIDDLRPDFSTGLIPMIMLESMYSEQQWNAQPSEVALNLKATHELTTIWSESKGVHSIETTLRWVFSLNELNVQRVATYREVCDLAKALKGQKSIPISTLEHLWLGKDNGVADIGKGSLAPSDFERNRAFLEQQTLQIIENPSSMLLDTIRKQWETAKKSKQLKNVRHEAIKRVFAVADPLNFTCIPNTTKFGQLVAELRGQFLLDSVQPGNWVEKNHSLFRILKPMLSSEWSPYELNIALLAFYEKCTGQKPLQEKSILRPIQPQDTAEEPVTMQAGGNIIFFGPPGTGKTFHVIEAAVKTAQPELSGCEDRDQLKAEYDALLASGRIRFITFHQSFSYEEFIEGLRAKTDDAGQISYSVEPGIFKQICTDATFGKATTDSPLENAIEAFKVHLEAENRMTLTTKRGKSFGVEFHGNKTFRAFPESTGNANLDRGYPVAIEHIWNEYQGVNRDRIYNPSYVKAILSHLIEEYDVPAVEENISASSPESFVLIIDEINRGNISKIFGELITLIEPSKRAGQKEALSVQLPYSGDTFTVPANLHIIGTMNTADRSLATMDTALRRRFDFIEMMPDYRQLDAMTVKGINIGALLRTLNDRIEYLYDREHTLGHAFFMPIAEKENEQDKFAELGSIFKKKILPLLQEYFFEDWGKIRLILGDNRKGETALQFVTKQESDVRYLFGDDFPSDELSDAREVYAINDDAFANPDAYLRVISQ